MTKNGPTSRQESCASKNEPHDRKPIKTTLYNQLSVLNDQFRTTGIGGMIVMTPGIQCLDRDTQIALFAQIRDYDDFSPDNDPYSEHDFGRVEIGDQVIFWKIDYYDRDLIHCSPNPANPDCTTRVLTVMLAQEY